MKEQTRTLLLKMLYEKNRGLNKDEITEFYVSNIMSCKEKTCPVRFCHYTNYDMEKILTITPINKMAAIIVSQKGCSDTVLMENTEEMNETLEKLKLRQLQIKTVLGITKRCQLKNIKYYKKQYHNELPLFQELLANGKAINDLMATIKKSKKPRVLTYPQIFMNTAEQILHKDIFEKIKTIALTEFELKKSTE